MADFNRVMLIGRATRDPQLKFLPGGGAVCDFGLATGRKFKTQTGEEREETLFVDCTLFGKGAEVFNQYVRKGKLVFVEGRLKLDQWDDKQTGQKRSKIGVVVENFQFLGSPRGEGEAHDEGDRPSRAGDDDSPRREDFPFEDGRLPGLDKNPRGGGKRLPDARGFAH